MKTLFIAAFTALAFSAQAQENILLDQKFWQGKPGVAALQAEVAKGASPSQLNPMSFDAVVMAINNEAPVESIKYLLAQPGNDVNKLTHDGRNYLHWAASKGNVEVMEYLLSKGAKVDKEDSHGYTPLNFAANSGQQNTNVYELCLAHGADLKKDLTPDGANALLLAVGQDNNFTVTTYFLSKGLDLKATDARGNTAFNYAAKSGNIDILKGLLQRGVAFNDNAMIMASQGTRRTVNTLEVYQYLESLKIKPTATGNDGENVLHYIVGKPNQGEIITYFLSKGVDINQADNEGNTPFMRACAAGGNTAVLELLMPKLKDINQTNKKGVSALAMAVQGNSPEVVAYLLKNGADVQVTDAEGNNLAYYLVQSYREGGRPGPGGPRAQQASGGRQQDDFGVKLQLLAEKGLDVALPQKNGNTLYHLAVVKNDLGLLKRIEKLNIDVNSKNKEGLTALHRAAMVSHDDKVIKYLLSIGAKKDILTGFDESAYDLAGENESFSKNNISLDFLK
ncbi:ankyrin repeat domain-containing protein [Olivibacter sitiensis]|uniref:ankyrin repeat domain-containing protein n=1 Tax=Olivibacter sitiensis TaxID=376470 RepID=UPI000426C51A|nr:ankyrin repeat domain-containing protein [Olivibacter sitiensis]